MTRQNPEAGLGLVGTVGHEDAAAALRSIRHTKPQIPGPENPDGWGADGTHSVGCSGCQIVALMAERDALQAKIDAAILLLQTGGSYKLADRTISLLTDGAS